MKDGFTLIELLIYLVILAIIIVLVGEVFILFVSSEKKIEARKEVEKNLDIAVKKITQSIKEASDISGDYPSNTLSLNNATTTYTFENGVLKKDGISITSDKVMVATTSDFLYYKLQADETTKPGVQIKMKVNYKSGDPKLSAISAETQTSVSLR